MQYVRVEISGFSTKMVNHDRCQFIILVGKSEISTQTVASFWWVEKRRMPNKNLKKRGSKMSFCKMLELLQRKDEGNIIFANSGTFYIARGRDAVLLHNILNLKVNCMETEVCKVGFPLNAL